VSVREWESLENSPTPCCNRNNTVMELPVENRVNFLLVFEDSNALLTCNDNCQIVLWCLNTGKEIRSFNGHISSIFTLCKISASIFASAGDDKSLKFWNIDTGQLLLNIPNAHSTNQEDKGEIRSIIYSPSEQLLVSAIGEDVVKVWKLKFNVVNNVQSCTELFKINNPATTHNKKTLVYSADDTRCWSMVLLDSTRVLVGDYDGYLFIIDIKAGTALEQVRNGAKFAKAHFSCVRGLTKL